VGSISSIFSKSLLRASLRAVQPTPTITSSPILLNTSSISSLQAEMSVTVVQEHWKSIMWRNPGYAYTSWST
jgi:hypothetical protein